MDPKKSYLPIMLEMSRRNILIIGAGSGCAEKLRSLGELGKTIRVIAPQFHEAFLDKPWIEQIRRPYRPGDLHGYHLIYVGINDPATEEQILDEARREGALVNFVDRVSKSDFIAPSVLIRENFSIFISTYGQGPGATKRIRKSIEESLNLDELDETTGRYIRERNEKKNIDDQNGIVNK